MSHALSRPESRNKTYDDEMSAKFKYSKWKNGICLGKYHRFLSIDKVTSKYDNGRYRHSTVNLVSSDESVRSLEHQQAGV